MIGKYILGGGKSSTCIPGAQIQSLLVGLVWLSFTSVAFGLFTSKGEYELQMVVSVFQL